MSGGILIDQDSEPEQVLIGEYKGMKVLILSVKPNEESARLCWKAAHGLIDTGAFDGSPAVIIDISKASVRHGYITEMSHDE